MTKTEEIILKYFKTPFDQEEANEILQSENAIKSHTAIAIVFGMLEAGKLLGRQDELIAILNNKPIEGEDLL